MKDEQLWAIYFAGVCALRFHPRNDTPETPMLDRVRVKFAAGIADNMLAEHRTRFPPEEVA